MKKIKIHICATIPILGKKIICTFMTHLQIAVGIGHVPGVLT